MIARVVLSEGDQPNVLVPNFDNPNNLVRKELESECVCQTVVTVNFLMMKCTLFNCKWMLSTDPLSLVTSVMEEGKV